MCLPLSYTFNLGGDFLALQQEICETVGEQPRCGKCFLQGVAAGAHFNQHAAGGHVLIITTCAETHWSHDAWMCGV